MNSLKFKSKNNEFRVEFFVFQDFKSWEKLLELYEIGGSLNSQIFNFSSSGSDDSRILLLLHVLVIIEEAVFTVILDDELNLTIILF